MLMSLFAATQDMASDCQWEAPSFIHDRLPPNQLSCNLPLLSPSTCPSRALFEYSQLEDAPYSQHASQAHPSLFTTTHDQQTGHNVMCTQMNVAQDPLPTAFQPLVSRNSGVDAVMSASHSLSQQGVHSIYPGNLATFNPSGILWPLPPGRHSFAHDIGQDIHHSSAQLLDHPSARLTLSHTAHSDYPNASNDQSVTDLPFIPSHPTNNQSFTPTPVPWCSRPETHRYLATGFGSHCMPPQNPPASLRPKRVAHAIEYGGLWLDEEELFQNQRDGDGKLTVHQCLWDKDLSPCHLWVGCDKSSINVHLQRWHAVKPGGDKLRADCRWSVCAKTMLKESISRHVSSVHLGEVWECQRCGKRVTRKDAYGRHAAECLNAGAVITYSVDVLEIDARAALNSGGRLRYADG